MHSQIWDLHLAPLWKGPRRHGDNRYNQLRPRAAVVNTTETYPPYATKREFTADRNSPRFTIEPKFREAVEQRMIKTNWNTLPE